MLIKTSLEKVNQAITKMERAGRVAVEGSGGSFSVKGVRGRFRFHQDIKILEIVIDDKPWLASESMIENEIEKFFN